MATTCLASQTAGRESPQDWLVRLDIDVATFCNMRTSKQPKLSHLAVNFFLNQNPLPLCGYPLPFTYYPIEVLVVMTSLLGRA